MLISKAVLVETMSTESFLTSQPRHHALYLDTPTGMHPNSLRTALCSKASRVWGSLLQMGNSLFLFWISLMLPGKFFLLRQAQQVESGYPQQGTTEMERNTQTLARSSFP